MKLMVMTASEISVPPRELVMNSAERQTKNATNRISTSLLVLRRRCCGTLFHSIDPRGRFCLTELISRISHTAAHEPKYVAAVFRLMKVAVRFPMYEVFSRHRISCGSNIRAKI